MATSTNYGWSEPDNTSLVKDGAQAIRTLGDAIDTSLWNSGYGQAGKNKYINGDFGVWQRGTSFTIVSTDSYTADRWLVSSGSGGTCTVTQQTFTPGAAPVAGYEGATYLQAAYSVSGTGSVIYQKIEDVRKFAGNTVTVSFWGRITSGTKTGCYVDVVQNFGSGGSGAVVSSSTDANFTLTTTWTRFTQVVPVASISGKTIGTSSFIYPRLQYGTSGTSTYQFWGMQIEYGSKATPFQTATGTIQGELAACQRYFYQIGGTSLSGGDAGNGHYYNTTNAYILTTFPVTMRTAPTCSFANIANWSVYSAGSGRACTAFGASSNSPYNAVSAFTTAATTAGNGGWLEQTNANAALTFSAEL